MRPFGVVRPRPEREICVIASLAHLAGTTDVSAVLYLRTWRLVGPRHTLVRAEMSAPEIDPVPRLAASFPRSTSIRSLSARRANCRFMNHAVFGDPHHILLNQMLK